VVSTEDQPDRVQKFYGQILIAIENFSAEIDWIWKFADFS